MDLLLTSALRELCHDSAEAYSRYIVDVQDVSIVRDSGLALLLMLKRLANRTGATLYVINGSADLMHRCLKLGIQSASLNPGGANQSGSAGGAVEHPRLCR